MNTFSKTVSFQRLVLFSVLFLAVLAMAGCGVNGGVGSNETRIQIIVSDDQSSQPIKKAEVQLILPQQLHPLKYTDNTGRVIFEIDRDMIDEIAQIDIKREGYEPETRQIQLSTTPILTVYLVRLGATAVPRETPSITPIPPTPRPNDTQTPVPTDTAVPTDTPEPTSTATQTPSPESSNGPVTVIPREGAATVYILAGPDVENVRLGTLERDESGEIIGRTEQNEWLQIISDRDIQGWVANCEVTLSSSNLSNVAITWDGLVTAKDCGVADTSSGSGTGINVGSGGSCVNVSLSRTDWPGKEFDDILMSWSNVPATSTRLKLWVTGPTNDGKSAFVIHPTFSETNIAYKVELFKFEDGNFKPGATYTYVVQPFNAANQIICTKQGTFVP